MDVQPAPDAKQDQDNNDAPDAKQDQDNNHTSDNIWKDYLDEILMPSGVHEPIFKHDRGMYIATQFPQDQRGKDNCSIFNNFLMLLQTNDVCILQQTILLSFKIKGLFK